jgi:hypothetical protein
MARMSLFVVNNKKTYSSDLLVIRTGGEYNKCGRHPPHIFLATLAEERKFPMPNALLCSIYKAILMLSKNLKMIRTQASKVLGISAI